MRFATIMRYLHFGVGPQVFGCALITCSRQHGDSAMLTLGPGVNPALPVNFKHNCRLHEYCMELCSSSGAKHGFGLPLLVFLRPEPALLTLLVRSITYTRTIAETGQRLTAVATRCSGSNKVNINPSLHDLKRCWW